MPNSFAPRPMADDELFIERTFAAPAQLVFDMWSKREHMLRWMGPADSRCTEAEIDFRVGGAWSARVLMERYGEARMGGRYLEIDPGRRIVMTFNWLHDSTDPETVITLTFTEVEGKTIQTFHQTPFENVPRRDSHINGWNEAFDTEQAYAERTAKEQAR
jgi:uncharacterized protein YndB with AHSA1/START domain